MVSFFARLLHYMQSPLSFNDDLLFHVLFTRNAKQRKKTVTLIKEQSRKKSTKENNPFCLINFLYFKFRFIN